MKKELEIIKEGKTGHGILIEKDGYMYVKNPQTITEGIDGEWHVPHPFIVDAVFQKFGVKNANGRIYTESVLKREVEKYMEKVREKRAIGECNHPSESVIDLSRVAINIIELHWEGHTLVGKLEILMSPAFVKYGMITCQGDQVANLLLQGIKIGVSSRGLGTVTNKMGVLYVDDDYEIVCWDVVSDPSTPNAWITKEDEIPRQYVESKENEDKPKIFEKIDKFNDWLVL